MSRAKNAVANGNPNKHSDNRSNLNPFRQPRLKSEVHEDGKVTPAVISPRMSIILILDELGARTVTKIPRAVLRNRNMFEITEEQGVLMVIKQGTNSSVIVPEVIAEDLHPIEVLKRKSDNGYYEPRSHHHKRTSKLNAGHVVRNNDRKLMRAAFVV